MFARFLFTSALAALLVIAGSGAAVAAPLGLHGAKRIGVKTDRPFMYLIPATGTSLSYSAVGLPAGLSLNSSTGIITGTASVEASYPVRFMVQDATLATSTMDVEIVVGQKAMALTPIMGWNPWYVWGCAIDDSKIRQAADLIVSTGLAAYGYNYINLDDCWQGQRDAAGVMVPNARFPDMAALTDYVHSKGLRVGIYTGPGPKTCAGYAGTADHDYDKGKSYLDLDVATYAKWGFDFIKYDWCIFPKEKSVKDYYLTKQEALYQRMSDALDKSPRAFVHMICQYGENNIFQWGEKRGGNMWRTNNDLADEWQAVIVNGFNNIALSQYAGPGHWNDLDMLMVGKANWPSKLGQYDIPNAPPRPTKLTINEQQTHMALWSMMASPLLFSGDLAQVDQVALDMLTNPDILDLNQDSLGAPVTVVRDSGGVKVLSRRLADGSLALGIFNLNDTETTTAVFFRELGFADNTQLKARNMWRGFERPATNGVRTSVGSHGVTMLKLSPL